MLGVLLMNTALALGQPVAEGSPLPFVYPSPTVTSVRMASPASTDPSIRLISDGLPALNVHAEALPGLAHKGDFSLLRSKIDAGGRTDTPKPVVFDAPLMQAPAVKPAEAVAPTPEAAAADRWPLMVALQGTWYGALLDDNRMYLYGWLEGSMNVSSSSVNNQPVVWTDRANEPLFQQGWVRFGRSVVTSGTTDLSFGFQIDTLIGSDYRFTLPRGLLNSQLQNSHGNQNVYGVDPIQHYVAAYVPTLFQGAEFRVGRLYCPWGVESLEAVSTPLVTRSYAFNWSSPFTHCGIGAYTTFSPVWSGTFMAVNGNDVYFGDPAAEWRFVGSLKWTQPDGGKNTVNVATSIGRGKFNEGEPYAAATVALANEPAGRNNINIFDIVWTHTFSPKFAYNMEAIYGYQTNVPGITNAAGGGTAHWASVAHYLFYTLTPELSSILRVETFDDFQGQRTGFEGLYTSVTAGLNYKPTKNLILRPEIRYDYNYDSRPFEGKHGIFVASADLILRF